MGMMETFVKAKNEYLSGKPDEKLEKAKFFVYSSSGVKSSPIVVQFNPSEYTLTRGINLAGKPGLGKDSDGKEVKAVSGQPATLRLSFYFDTWSDFGHVGLTDLLNVFSGDAPGGTKNKMKHLLGLNLLKNTHKDPQLVADMLMSMIKFEPKEHQPAEVEFMWGSLDFKGKVATASCQYTMFSPNGTPVRAKVDISMVGEEEGLAKQIMQFPRESPDRTKERTMIVGDQLWMLANDEYNDPSMWKTIAEANEVLNPRSISKTVSLKVPSIR